MRINLKDGVVPINKAAPALNQLIRRSHEQQIPIVITQRGEASAVLLSLDVYLSLVAQATQQPASDGGLTR